MPVRDPLYYTEVGSSILNVGEKKKERRKWAECHCSSSSSSGCHDFSTVTDYVTEGKPTLPPLNYINQGVITATGNIFSADLDG